ncbi:MAG: hypothetical protein DCC75_10295, partial [Proteobacteria bacterium]
TLFIDTLNRYLRTKGYKRLAVIKTEDPFLNSLTDALRNTLTGSENMQVLVSFSPGDSDFKSAIARLRGGAFDAVGLYLFPGQVSSFYRQLAAVNLKIPTFGSDIFDSRTEIANAGPAMQGAVFPNVEVPEEFRTRYREMFGNDLQLAYGYNAYITFKAIAQLVRLRDESPQKEFSNLLLEPSAYTGLKEFELNKDKFGGIYFDFPLEMREVRGEGTELVTATYIPIFKNKN